MNAKAQRIVILVLLGCLALGSMTLAAPLEITLERWVLPGGGGIVETAPYNLHGTIGQSVVGGMHNAAYELGAGFWGGLGAVEGHRYRIYLPIVLNDYSP